MNDFEDTRFPNDISPQRLRMLSAAQRQIDTLDGGLSDLQPFSTKQVSERVDSELAALSVRCITVVIVAVVCAYVVVSADRDWRLTEPSKAVEIVSAK
jgi:hypothetical protein